MTAKYQIVYDDFIEHFDKKYYRIRALKTFFAASDCGPYRRIKAGDLGGYVESERNLSQSGTCWIFDDSMAIEWAQVKKDAVVMSCSRVMGHALVTDYAKVHGYDYLEDEEWKHCGATIAGYAIVKGFARVSASEVSECAEVRDYAVITSHAQIITSAEICGRSIIEGCTVAGRSRVCDRAYLSGTGIRVMDNAKICKNAFIETEMGDDAEPHITIGGNACICGNAHISNPAKKVSLVGNEIIGGNSFLQ